MPDPIAALLSLLTPPAPADSVDTGSGSSFGLFGSSIGLPGSSVGLPGINFGS